MRAVSNRQQTDHIACSLRIVRTLQKNLFSLSFFFFRDLFPFTATTYLCAITVSDVFLGDNLISGLSGRLAEVHFLKHFDRSELKNTTVLRWLTNYF